MAIILAMDGVYVIQNPAPHFTSQECVQNTESGVPQLSRTFNCYALWQLSLV